MSKIQTAYERMQNNGKIKKLPKLQENLTTAKGTSSAIIEILAEKISSLEKRLQILENKSV